MGRKAFTREPIINELRDELLNREVFTTLPEVQILIEEWRKEYNQVWGRIVLCIIGHLLRKQPYR